MVVVVVVGELKFNAPPATSAPAAPGGWTKAAAYKKPRADHARCTSPSVPVRVKMNLVLALACMFAVMSLFCGKCKAAPGGLITSVRRNLENHPHIHGYAVEGLMRDLVEDLIGEDEDGLRLSKRQHLGDYDHMRFGKRTNEDDEYRRSRFNRNIE